ncbi:MAG: HAMP domain-containing protein [Clostridiaceae bacterium]|nr:HAMP domain-containing protein [Clostridiaceae bacterium]
MRKTFFISLKMKIIILSVFLVIFCSVLIGGYVLTQLPTITINTVGRDYINLLASISKQIDMERFISLKSSDIDSEYYKKMDEDVDYIKELMGLDHLYLFKKNAQNEFFQLTGRADGIDVITGATSEADVISEATSEVDIFSGATAVSRDSANISHAMRESFAGKEQFELQDHPQWGKIFSIYYPLKDSSGDTIGVLTANLSGEAAYKTFTEVRNRILTIGLIVLTVGIIISIAFSSFLVKSIQIFKKHVERIKAGDLTENLKISRNDEIGLLGESFNSLNNALASIVGKIREQSRELNDFAAHLASISEHIAHSSTETTQSVSEIAAGANQQAGELLYISDRLVEFNETVEKIYYSLEATRKKIEETNRLSSEGNTQLQRLNQSIKSSSESFEIVSDRINQLSVNAQQIDEINSVIQNIAAQTNLLALNAAIEASRAGEAGKGFTVVADEIRKLAEQSKDSSDKIRVIVDEIIASVESVVTTSSEAESKFTHQVEIIENTNKAFLNIIESLEEAVPVLKETFERADEVVKSKDIIIEKIDAVSAVSQQTSAGAQEILKATETISAQTEEIAAFAKTLHNSADGLYNETKIFTIKDDIKENI